MGSLLRMEKGEMSTLAKRPKGAVQKYNPEKGLKTIAVAETAEKYYRRAKDPEKLTQAVEVKLTAQREFVAWWDQQEKDKGGRPEKTRSRSGTGFHADAFVPILRPEELTDLDRFVIAETVRENWHPGKP